ncbi:hypothetical protein ASE93_12440 [Serratia sp. Leaf50]|nr:hypothetical protein ASE93_12440 [Serratia sp. Leaf50]
MRDFAKISPTFWMGSTQKKIRELGSEALVVSLYLMTCPHSNMIGLYYLPIIYLAHETGLGVEGAKEGLARAESVGFCRYDPESEMVWIPGMAHSQIGRCLKATDKQCKGVQNTYDLLPDNPYLSDFFLMYRDDYHLHNRRYFTCENPKAHGGASEGLASKENEKEQEKENKTPHSAREEFLPASLDVQIADNFLNESSPMTIEIGNPADFPMTGNWLPQTDFLHRVSGYVADELLNFVMFWQAGGKVFNQAQWEQKFERSIMNYRKQSTRNLRQKTGGLYAKATAGCAFVSNAVLQVRAARNAERIRQGLVVLGDYGDDLCQSLVGKKWGSAHIALDSQGVAVF